MRRRHKNPIKHCKVNPNWYKKNEKELIEKLLKGDEKNRSKIITTSSEINSCH